MLRIDRIVIERNDSTPDDAVWRLIIQANIGAGPLETMTLLHENGSKQIEMHVSGDYENMEWLGIMEDIPINWFPGYGDNELSGLLPVIDGEPHSTCRGGIIVKNGTHVPGDVANREILESLCINAIVIERDMEDPEQSLISIQSTCMCPPNFTGGVASLVQNPLTNDFCLVTEATQVPGEPPTPVNFPSFPVTLSMFGEQNFMRWIIWDNLLGPIDFNLNIGVSGGAYLEV